MDAVNEDILQCLLVDGRAPVRRIAGVVGVSEQTAARRYRAMVDDGAVRVLVRQDAGLGGSWLLRLQCRPDAAAELGTVLATRPDVGWVALCSGGAELMCTTTLPPDAGCGTGVLPRLSRTSAVLSFTAFSVLHTYAGAGAPWSGFDRPLSADRLALLGDHAPRPAAPLRSPDADDQLLLEHLGVDARASVASLARALGWPASRVSTRLQALFDDGVAEVDVDVLLERFGFRTSATLLVQTAPDRTGEVGEAMSRHPQTSWVAAVTGAANLAAAVTCRTSHDLFRYVTDTLGPLPGVRHVEIVPLLRRLKQASTRVVDGRLERQAA